MKAYLIRKDNFNYQVNNYNLNVSGYALKPKSKRRDNISVKELTLVNDELIYSLIISNFNKNYKRLLKLVFSIMATDEDTTTGDVMLALDEIERLRRLIISKYELFIESEKEEELLKKLRLLENELRSKLRELRVIEDLNYDEEKSYGR